MIKWIKSGVKNGVNSNLIFLSSNPLASSREVVVNFKFYTTEISNSPPPVHGYIIGGTDCITPQTANRCSSWYSLQHLQSLICSMIVSVLYNQMCYLPGWLKKHGAFKRGVYNTHTITCRDIYQRIMFKCISGFISCRALRLIKTQITLRCCRPIEFRRQQHALALMTSTQFPATKQTRLPFNLRQSTREQYSLPYSIHHVQKVAFYFGIQCFVY